MTKNFFFRGSYYDYEQLLFFFIEVTTMIMSNYYFFIGATTMFMGNYCFFHTGNYYVYGQLLFFSYR